MCTLTEIALSETKPAKLELIRHITGAYICMHILLITTQTRFYSQELLGKAVLFDMWCFNLIIVLEFIG